jgi:FMN reductase
MNDQPTILGLGGSLAAGSRTELLLRSALREAKAQGMRPKLFGLAARPVPPLSPETVQNPPENVRLLLHTVRAADVLALAAPVYHGTIAGSFKNVIDYLDLLGGDDPPWLSGKAVGLMAVGATTAAGYQTVSAMDHFCRALRALTVPTVVVADSSFAGTDGVLPGPLAERITRMCGELRRYAPAREPALVAQP